MAGAGATRQCGENPPEEAVHLPAEETQQWLAEILDPKGRALVVSPGADWVRPPKGLWIDLTRRHKPRSLLFELTRRRHMGRSDVASVDDVIDALWPDQNLVGHSGRDRVYQTIRILRRLGLGAMLVQEEEGYRLCPETRLIWLAEHW